MAAFKQHIMFSTALGVGYTVTLRQLGLDWVHSSLAGSLCAVSGMLPDLDSDSGKPVQEMFSFTAAMAPLLLLQRVRNADFSPEGTILLMVGLYVLIRFGAAWLFKKITVHRGMFHSLPAALIAAEIVYLVHECPERYGQLSLAAGVLLGFMSHLVLDEIYSVDVSGLTVRLNKAAGSAIKLTSQSIPATLTTWLLLGVLTYFIFVREGYLQPLEIPVSFSLTASAAQ